MPSMTVWQNSCFREILRMEVIVLTTLFSVLFAVFFLLLFVRMRQNRDSCADQDSLIPFRGDELTRPPLSPTPGELVEEKSLSEKSTDE